MTKITVLGKGAPMSDNSPPSGPTLNKQGYWSGEKWTPGVLPTGVLRTKVRYSDAPYMQSSSVENPKARSPRKA